MRIVKLEDVGSNRSPRKPSNEEGRRETYPLLTGRQNG